MFERMIVAAGCDQSATASRRTRRLSRCQYVLFEEQSTASRSGMFHRMKVDRQDVSDVTTCSHMRIVGRHVVSE